MNNLYENDQEHLKLYNAIVNKEHLEDKAFAALTSETLRKLDATAEKLPRESRSLIERVSNLKTALRLHSADPASMCLHSSRDTSERLEDEYETLQLEHKNAELQAKIDRNNRFITKLKRDLENSKRSLAVQNPNPDNIQEVIKQLKHKLTAYEDSYDLAKNKYSALNIPEAILPKSLRSQVATLQSLREEATALKLQADEVILVRDTKKMLTRLRR